MPNLKINWIMAGANLKGGTKSNRLIAEAMVRRGHEVNIAFVSLSRPWPKASQMRRWLRRALHEAATLGREPHHLEHSTANLIPVKERIIRADHVPDADVTVATWWETREWIETWPKEKGLKAYFVRGHELHGGDPRRVAKTYQMPGLKFVISSWLKRIMSIEYGDHDAILVPNGIDRNQFNAPIRGKQSSPTVGFLYGHQEIKGASTAIDALHKVKARYPKMSAIAFGATKPIKAHRLPPWIDFHLQPEQHKIPRLYQQTDCWIIPSTTEGFGMPGLEAAACRCPVVSTRCGGPEDFVKDSLSGFLVPIEDPDAMAEAVCRVLEMPNGQWRAMSQASFEISKQFDWDRSAQIIEQAIIDALGRHQCSDQIMQRETQ